jgi:hypothetical protein
MQLRLLWCLLDSNNASMLGGGIHSKTSRLEVISSHLLRNRYSPQPIVLSEYRAC